ncbi:nucleoside hydrolase-like [Anoplopoma fimbria]|uniref:nucleoside hydrolase-like n=1 Tax=Anoplopoma fimbria TaxID=229290 RepID=UPI0023EDAB90|nr:nucleoside hydrolase-like [Anoplopoma fimbria]
MDGSLEEEFTFVADPEAAYIVLDRYTCPTYIAPWEFSCRNSLPWSFCDRWLGQNTEKAAFMKKITSLSMKKAQSADYQKEITEGKGFNSCDTYAMAAAIDDTFITESDEVSICCSHVFKTQSIPVQIINKKCPAFSPPGCGVEWSWRGPTPEADVHELIEVE